MLLPYFKMMCLGANGVFVGKVLIQLLGCVGNEQGRCNSCNTGKCPMGICTQDPRLVKRLDIDKGAQKIVDYVLAFDAELKKLMAPIGNSSNLLAVVMLWYLLIRLLLISWASSMYANKGGVRKCLR